MKTLIIDPESGMAGDMFSAAIIAAGAPEEKLLAHMRQAAECLGGIEILAKQVTRGKKSNLTRGIILDIKLLTPPHSKDAEVLRKSLEEYLTKSGIKREYYDFAMDALGLLIVAEKKAHEKMDGHQSHHHHCHLHEAQDIIIDITGAAWGLQYLTIDINHISCLSPVITGYGKINFSHGELDVPAPATASIIEDYAIPVHKGSIETELLTPTGATILAALKPEHLARDSYTPEGSFIMGTGFGIKDFSGKNGKPNGLNLYIGK